MFHIHCHDVRLKKDAFARGGEAAYPLDIMTPVMPGHGDVDWGAFFAALCDVGFDGGVSLAFEDRAYEISQETITEGSLITKRFLNQFVI